MNNDIVTGAGVEACMARRSTPQTSDPEVQGSSLACDIVSSDKELYSTLSLFTHNFFAGV